MDDSVLGDSRPLVFNMFATCSSNHECRCLEHLCCMENVQEDHDKHEWALLIAEQSMVGRSILLTRWLFFKLQHTAHMQVNSHNSNDGVTVFVISPTAWPVLSSSAMPPHAVMPMPQKPLGDNPVWYFSLDTLFHCSKAHSCQHGFFHPVCRHGLFCPALTGHFRIAMVLLRCESSQAIQVCKEFKAPATIQRACQHDVQVS